MRPRKKLRRRNGSPAFWGAWEDRTERAAIRPEYRGGLIGWFVNNAYSVRLWKQPSLGIRTVEDWDEAEGVLQVSIMRVDGKPGVPWPDKQRIKDELVGEGRLAIEVFPPKDQLVDPANLYYLWVLPVGYDLPFRLFEPSDPVGSESL